MTDGALQGKAAIVTGAASGIGRAVAERLQAEGMDVLAVDLRPDPGGPGTPFEADLTDASANEQAVNAARERFGRLDVVVHGEPLRQGGGTLGRWPDSDFVRGLFNVTRGALPAMRAQHAGRIHHLVPPTRPGTGPGGSLFSIAGFCAAVAADVAADGIAVTAVEPAEAHARIFAEWAMGDDELLEEA